MFIHIFKENNENKLTYNNNFVVEINGNLERYAYLNEHVCKYVIYQKNDIIIILNLHDVAVESSLHSSGTEVYFNTFFSWRS